MESLLRSKLSIHFNLRFLSFFLTYALVCSNHYALAQSLTLAEAMKMAEERNIATQSSKLNKEIAEAKIGQAKGSLYPRLDMDAQRIWFQKSANELVGKSPQFPSRVTTAGIQLVQPIIGMAPLFLQIQAATLQSESASLDESTSKRDVRILGAQAFLNAQKALQLISIAELSHQVSESLFKESKAQLRAGKISQADSMRFELALTEAKQQLSLAHFTYKIAHSALLEILNRPSEIVTLEAPKESRWEASGLSISDLETTQLQAKEGRSEAKNASSNVKVAQYYKLASELDYLPSLNFFTRYERDFEAKDSTVPATGPSATKYSKKDIQDKFSFGLQLKWTLWDWGTRSHRSEEFISQVQKAKLAVESAESGIRLDVTKSFWALKGALESLDTAKTSIKLAEEIYRLTQVRFRNGQATSTDVVAAERDQTKARGGLVNIRADLDLAWLQLQRSIGKSPEL
jgi:OMF family outer membrane factor